MKRVITKIGDVFSVKINDSHKKFFQLIAFDLTQLNSDVIRAFKEAYPIEANPDLSAIVNGDIEFYAHCVTKFGIKLGLWERISNIKEIGKLDHILFRGTSDLGHKVGEEPIRVSYNWYVWRIGDKNFTRVGKLEGENQKAEIGLVINPYSIIDRIKTGKYKGFYPDYE